MIRRLRKRGLGRLESGLTGLAVLAGLVALVVLAVKGLPSVTTERVERVETTKRVPVPVPGRTRERSVTRMLTERETRTLIRGELRELRGQAREIARAEVTALCVRMQCSRPGPRGPRGARGADGEDGAPGRAGRDALGVEAHRLDAGLLDGVDNRVAELEGLLAALRQRLGVLEGVVRLLCPLLQPQRCAGL